MPEEGNSVAYSILGEVALRVGDPSVPFKSGCTVLDLALTDKLSQVPATIEFENYYTSRISVRVKGFFHDNTTEEWRTVLKDYVLMPDPHAENGSQSFFRIHTEKVFSDLPKTISGMRIILKQPSPHWNRFSVENLKLSVAVFPSVESQKTDLEAVKGNANKEDELLSYGLVLNSVTSKLAQVAEMHSKLQSFTTNSAEESGKFEVDGSYEVNLLSYT